MGSIFIDVFVVGTPFEECLHRPIANLIKDFAGVDPGIGIILVINRHLKTQQSTRILPDRVEEGLIHPVTGLNRAWANPRQ